MCGGTSCSQQFYTERGRGAGERRGPRSSGLEIIKRSRDHSVSITAHIDPENKPKSPYLMQTHIHKKRGKSGFLYFCKISVYFFFLQAELLDILALHPISLTLWQCHDTVRDGGGRGAAMTPYATAWHILSWPKWKMISRVWRWRHGTFFIQPSLTDRISNLPLSVQFSGIKKFKLKPDNNRPCLLLTHKSNLCLLPLKATVRRHLNLGPDIRNSKLALLVSV